MRYFFSSILFIALAMPLFSQESEIQVFASPPDAWVKVNGTAVDLAGKPQPYVAKVSPGTYTVEVWAYGMVLQRETVAVAAGEKKQVRVGLKNVDPAFQTYRSARGKANLKSAVRIATTSICASAALVSFGYAIKQGTSGNHKEQALEAAKDYQRAVSLADIQASKDAFEYHQRKHNDGRKALVIGSTAGLAFTGLTVWYISWQRRHRIKYPVYEGKNPLVFTPTLDFAPRQGGSVGLVLNF